MDYMVNTSNMSLNPYSNGIRIEPLKPTKAGATQRLNPYSNGIRIERETYTFNRVISSVLILILMEYG